jgi:glycosyltransferase involved in cell wall biosynthesis
MKKETEKIAILLPCYNEEKTIGDVVQAFRLALPEAEIYVCNNNSTDKTKKNALEAGAIVIDEPKKGKAYAVEKLFRMVEADYYILSDGDLTYDAAISKTAIQKCKELSADMLIGVRKSVSGQKTYRPGHHFGNLAFTIILKIIFSGSFADVLSGYRVFSRNFVKSMPILSKGFDIEVEMTIYALSLNLAVGEFETNYYERPEGSVSKLNTFRDGFQIIKTILRLLNDYKPLLVFTLASLTFFILGIFLFTPIFKYFLLTGMVDRFPTAVLSLGLIILSVISFFSGLILDGITRSRLEAKKTAFLQCNK